MFVSRLGRFDEKFIEFSGALISQSNEIKFCHFFLSSFFNFFMSVVYSTKCCRG